MKERLQINIRLDNEPELFEAVKQRAEQLNTSINAFAIQALKSAMEWQVPVDAIKMQERINRLDQRVSELEKLNKK